MNEIGVNKVCKVTVNALILLILHKNMLPTLAGLPRLIRQNEVNDMISNGRGGTKYPRTGGTGENRSGTMVKTFIKNTIGF